MIQVLQMLAGFLTRLPVSFLPVRGRHVLVSAIVSADDDHAKPSDRLLDVVLNAAALARSISMASVIERMTEPPYYPDVWPGEHYKLLAGLVETCRPETVIEIGTATGLSALAMRTVLPAESRLVTFDIVPWNKFPDTCLRAGYFEDGTLSQVIGDVSDPRVLRQHADLFQDADLIFADGPKDGRFEQVFLDRLADLTLPKKPLIVLDDIRLWKMLAIWRAIRLPKLDITSFGHWSGTGIIDWVG
jgi:predicted O-methyltransferase YrrM